MDNLESDKRYNLLLVLGIVFSAIYVVVNIFNLLAYLYVGVLISTDSISYILEWLEIPSIISSISWILLLVVFGLYLSSVKLKSASTLIYAIAVIFMLSFILSLVRSSIAMTMENSYLLSFISLPTFVLSLIQIVLTVIVGFVLLSLNRNDSVSLKFPGIFFIIYGVLEVCCFLIFNFLLPVITKYGFFGISFMSAMYVANSLSSLGSILVGVGLFCMFWKDYNNSDNSSSSYIKRIS